MLGYNKYQHDFGKLIWQIASPKWNFDDATFDRTAASFDNPDYVDIIIDVDRSTEPDCLSKAENFLLRASSRLGWLRDTPVPVR